MNIIDKKIIEVLYVANKPLNTNRIADILDISRPTILRHLKRLYNSHVVNAGRYEKGVYWWIVADAETIRKALEKKG